MFWERHPLCDRGNGTAFTIFSKTMKKIRLGIIFGGRSAEHEVSLQSATNIYEAIDKDKYDISLIGIDREGKLHALQSITALDQEKIKHDPQTLHVIPNLFRN